MKKFLAVLTISGIAAVSQADILLGWDVGGLPAAVTPSITSSVNDVNMTGLILTTRGAGLVANGSAANAFISTSWTLPVSATIADAVSSNDFYTFTANSVGGFTFSATNFTWRNSRSATGPTNWTLRTSVDSFAADVTTWTNSSGAAQNFSVDLGGSFSTVTQVEFRIYGYQTANAGGTARIADGGNIGSANLDMTLFGTTAAAVPEPAEATMLGLAAGIIYIMRRRKNKITA